MWIRYTAKKEKKNFTFDIIFGFCDFFFAIFVVAAVGSFFEKKKSCLSDWIGPIDCYIGLEPTKQQTEKKTLEGRNVLVRLVWLNFHRLLFHFCWCYFFVVVTFFRLVLGRRSNRLATRTMKISTWPKCESDTFFILFFFVYFYSFALVDAPHKQIVHDNFGLFFFILFCFALIFTFFFLFVVGSVGLFNCSFEFTLPNHLFKTKKWKTFWHFSSGTLYTVIFLSILVNEKPKIYELRYSTTFLQSTGFLPFGMFQIPERK